MKEITLKDRPKKKKAGIVFLVISIVVLLMITIYLGVGVYYIDRFFPGTTVNGIDVSGKTVKQAENLVGNQVQDYTLKVAERDGKSEQIFSLNMCLMVRRRS